MKQYIYKYGMLALALAFSSTFAYAQDDEFEEEAVVRKVVKVKKKQYDIAYAKTHLKRVPLDLRLDKYNEIKEHAESHDESINGFIKRAIDEAMERDNSNV